MIVFGSNSHRHKPQTFLNKLKDFAERYYSTSEIYQSSPTIVLELNHIKFELTPSYLLYGTYYIPNGQSDWMTTDPDGFSIKLIECNKSNDYKIKPIIRLLKYWNIQKNSRDMKSYKLEEEIADGLMYSYYSCSSYTDYLKAGFKEIKYNTNYSNVNTAIGYIDKAICYEEQGMSETALSEIKRLFRRCDMSRRDDVNQLYKYPNYLARFEPVLFWFDIIAGLIAVFGNVQVSALAIMIQIVVAVLYFVFNAANDGYFWYRAEKAR